MRLDAVIVGGAALSLLGVVTRQTRDCDVLYPDLAVDILIAAREFAAQLRAEGQKLDDDWLNNGPSALAELLPKGWYDRIQPAYTGEALTLHALGRSDFLKSKLFALCDRATDEKDCIALRPSAAEVDASVAWLTNQDANPEWPAHVVNTLAALKQRLGYGV